MSQPGTLNVIFHGQFAFVCTDECIEVLVPRVPDQSYQAGDPAGLRPLAQGASYLLSGVSRARGVTRFNPEKVPVVEGLRVIDRNPALLHCSIYVPIPEDITSLRHVPCRGFFRGESADRIAAKTVALVHVFTYPFDDLADLRIDGLGWLAAFASRTIVNLHVFADVDPVANPQPPVDHAKAAFQRAARLFPGLNLKLNDYGWIAPADPPLRGISLVDQRNLLERAQPLQAQLPDGDYRNCVSLVVDNT